jgi:tripartite-type tricarboxylate transporter receptor subunit TctC
VHVPYTVSATIIADLLGGRIQASFVPMAFVLPLLQDGRLRPLAVAAKQPVQTPLSAGGTCRMRRAPRSCIGNL